MTEYDRGYKDALEEIHNSLENVLKNTMLEYLNGRQAIALFKTGLKEDIENVR